jgi:hypothetical protein
MSDVEPTFVRRDGLARLVIQTLEPTASLGLECVIDTDDFHEIVGIEVLDFRRQLDGGYVGASPTSGFPRWSYDSEIDAAYFRLVDGRAQHQKRILGVAFLTSTKSVARIEFPDFESR